ncbi:SMP-30/gluconolactonase/LRE family protein [Brevundimonas sp.]|uniref:SMP-30/gluconolactonase/LRE family protein n=1 Tax=Brevundimonas sp. TaxID=1871086 RepID=UPI002FC7327E
MGGAPELVWDVKAELGEGPVWVARDRALWFVDIKGRRLHRYGHDDGSQASWEAPDQIGFALPAEDGTLICGVRGGLHRFDAATGVFSLIRPVETDRPGNRLNDGFVAPDGSLWFGSMDDAEESRSGALYRWTGGEPERMDDGYGVTNGPALSPDGRTMYHHDTLEKTIHAYDHADGRIAARRLFALTGDGYPDGPCVDADGVLHVGLFGGWGVDRFDPEGRPLGKIELPVPAVTKVAFAGDDLKTMYFTTAWMGMDAAQRAKAPAAGGLFRMSVDRPGLPQALIRL